VSQQEQKELLRFATRAIKGLPESDIFVGVYGDGPLTVTRAAFLMQLGYALLHDKRLIIPVPHGVTLPAKLEAVADAVVRYNPEDPASLQYGLEQALTNIGAKKH